jgi:hypothetical protein
MSAFKSKYQGILSFTLVSFIIIYVIDFSYLLSRFRFVGVDYGWRIMLLL